MPGWRLLLDPSGTYAAFVSDSGAQMIALQKDATTILPRTLADYGPELWAGEAARFDPAMNLLELGPTTLGIDAGFEFSGQFGAITFASPTGDPLTVRAANGTVIDGTCLDDDDTSTVGQLFIVSTPDGNAAAFGAWAPGAGRHVYVGLIQP